MKRFGFAVLACAALGACASITEGTHQEITVNTKPPGAKCVLSRSGFDIGTVNKTPGTVRIDKSKQDMVIACEKDEYVRGTYLNKSDFAAVTVGNVLVGGLVGILIDVADDAATKYDGSVTITLQPKLAGPDPAKVVPVAPGVAPNPYDGLWSGNVSCAPAVASASTTATEAAFSLSLADGKSVADVALKPNGKLSLQVAADPAGKLTFYLSGQSPPLAHTEDALIAGNAAALQFTWEHAQCQLALSKGQPAKPAAAVALATPAKPLGPYDGTWSGDFQCLPTGNLNNMWLHAAFSLAITDGTASSTVDATPGGDISIHVDARPDGSLQVQLNGRAPDTNVSPLAFSGETTIQDGHLKQSFPWSRSQCFLTLNKGQRGTT